MSMDIINCRVQCGTGQQQKTEYEDASSTATSGYHCKHWPICFWINGVQEWIEKKMGTSLLLFLRIKCLIIQLSENCVHYTFKWKKFVMIVWECKYVCIK